MSQMATYQGVLAILRSRAEESTTLWRIYSCFESINRSYSRYLIKGNISRVLLRWDEFQKSRSLTFLEKLIRELDPGCVAPPSVGGDATHPRPGMTAEELVDTIIQKITVSPRLCGSEGELEVVFYKVSPDDIL